MKSILKRALPLLLLVLSPFASAQSLIGTATVYDPTGYQIATYPSIGATLDLTARTMSISPFNFFGLQLSVSDIELLDPGVHTRPIGTVNVGTNQLGAFMTIHWGPNNIRMFLVWNKSVAGSAVSLVPADSDGDGIPGHRLVEGPFVGFTLVYEFKDPAAPGIEANIVNLSGNTYKACNQLGGARFNLHANVILLGDTQLQSIRWFLDGNQVATDTTVDLLVPVGLHTVELVASNTTGQSDSDTLGLNVSDYAAPVANVIFTDQRDGSEISAITENNMYFVVPNVSVTDVCDPAPQVSAVADTVSQVTEGFVMKIQGNNGSVSMPSSGVELRTTATDASGNTATQSFILPISN